MKQKLKKLWEEFKGIFYIPNWLKPYFCKWFGHKIMARYMVYEVEKKRWRGRDPQHKTGGNLEEKKSYNPYFVYYCSRCGVKIGSRRLARLLTKKEALNYTKGVIKDFNKMNEVAKSL